MMCDGERFMTDSRYVMGVDGGGSTVRVAITTPDLRVVGEARGASANPVTVGAETAARTIQAAMREAMRAAGVTPQQIAAVALGIAGAASLYSADWVRAVATDVLPDAVIVPSADFEIALVGALGQRCGVLLLAGTGSFAYGVNAAGETALVGAWGYLIDDAGSGYWVGMRAVEAVARAGDGRGPQTTLTERVLAHWGLAQPIDLVPWLYHSGKSRIRDIAAIAPLVLDAAAGDAVAQQIVGRACDELVLLAQIALRRLAMQPDAIALAGGLLTTPNALSDAVCAALGLDAIPQPRYSPVIGAALLARLSID